MIARATNSFVSSIFYNEIFRHVNERIRHSRGLDMDASLKTAWRRTPRLSTSSSVARFRAYLSSREAFCWRDKRDAYPTFACGSTMVVWPKAA